MLKAISTMRIKTKVMDAKTGKCLKESPWRSNLVLDQGLNAWANKAGTPTPASPAGSFAVCHIGGGTNPTKIASGGVTFTQVGTTLTASGGFFTSAMVNGLFKWGSGAGGVEVYITAFSSSTVVTVGTSATVAVPDVGTVWQVQATGLQTPLFTTNSYQTNAGDNSTTFLNNQVTFQRTFINPQQVSPYTVNEIGYSSTSGATALYGRIVLASSDVVGTSNFYVVIMQLQMQYFPDVPTAVGNVGTNIATAGNAAIEQVLVQTVTAAGGLTGGGELDISSSGGMRLSFNTVTYSQRANPSNSSFTFAGELAGFADTGAWVYASVRGQMTCTFNSSITTAGQSLFGVAIGTAQSHPVFDVKFTATQTAPTGTFQPISVFTLTFDRQLVN